VKRLASLPDVPSTVELGYTEMVMENWYGLVAPAGLPPDVAKKLEAAALAAIKSPAIQEHMRKGEISGTLNAKEFGARGISVVAVGPGPMDTPFFYPAEGADAVAYHKTAAALSPSSPSGLTHIEDVVPFIRHLVSDGWWVTGQTILINGGYTTK